MHPTLYAQLPFLTLHVLLSFDPSPPWDFFSAFVLALTCYLTISSNVLKLDSGVGSTNQGLGTTIAICAMDGFYMLLLGKPLRNFKYVGNINGSVRRVWWQKYLDAVAITQFPRLIGWSHQVKNVPPAPQQPRASFILRSTLRAVRYLVLFQVGQLYVWYNPAYSPSVIGTQGYITQGINAAVFIGIAYWTMNAMYFAAAAGSVAIGLNGPRVWPDLFGAWKDAYTVRRFWGRTWHQVLRRFLAPLGKAMATAIGFKPGTLESSYTQLYVAFFLSGLVHTGGDVTVSFHNSAPSFSFFSMPFFLLQAIAITLEDIFIWMARSLGVKSSVWTRVVGYAWVTAWFWWCLSGYVRNVIRAGGVMKETGAGSNDVDSNLVQALLGLLGFNVGAFIESWFSVA